MLRKSGTCRVAAAGLSPRRTIDLTLRKMKKIGGFSVLLMLFAGCATPKKQLNGVPLALPASTEPVELKIPVAGGASVVINPDGHSLSPDGQGWIRWETAGLPDTLHFEAGGRTWSLPTADWKLPYRYAVNADGEVQREWPWLEFRSRVPDTTYQPRLNLLCKSVYPGKAAINGDSVKMYRTGIFFREIALNEGANRVRAEVLGPQDFIELIHLWRTLMDGNRTQTVSPSR